MSFDDLAGQDIFWQYEGWFTNIFFIIVHNRTSVLHVAWLW